MKRILWGALVLSPVVWALLHEPGADSLPGDASRPAPRRRPRISNFRSDPLDDAGRAEGEAALRSLRERWQEQYDYIQKRKGGICGTQPVERLAREWSLGETKIRLFALGYPEVAEGWAQREAEDRSTPEFFRYKAVLALCILGEERWGAATSVLVRLCRAPESWARSMALDALIRSGGEGAHRDLLRRLAGEGDVTAMELLADSSDPAAAEIIRSAEPAISGRDWFVDDLLARIEARKSRSWEELARKTILEGEGGFWNGDYLRALRSCRERPWFERVARQRLDGEREISPATDDLLVALAETGGRLTAGETERLRQHGYAGDPRARLAEVLRERGYRR